MLALMGATDVTYNITITTHNRQKRQTHTDVSPLPHSPAPSTLLMIN
jgi:hypothetical protein